VFLSIFFFVFFLFFFFPFLDPSARIDLGLQSVRQDGQLANGQSQMWFVVKTSSITAMTAWVNTQVFL